MEPQTFGQRVKRTGKKVLRITIISLIVILAITFSFLYWGTYEDGVMAGKILRVSEKGMMFKTYEGKINLETFGALRDASPIAESFDFSVEKSDKELREELQQVALTGERVNLYFVKRYMTFPWRGDTKYFATRIERVGK
jgi:DNA-directed RNA polymerase subunit E'/Rpb7